MAFTYSPISPEESRAFPTGEKRATLLPFLSSLRRAAAASSSSRSCLVSVRRSEWKMRL